MKASTLIDQKSRFELLLSSAWTEKGEQMCNQDLWRNFADQQDQELGVRLCNLADSAASTYCGLFSADSPYFSWNEVIELPWMWDWHVSEVRPGGVSIRLKENIRASFFEEIDRLWLEFEHQRGAIEEGEGPLNLLQNYFLTSLTATKKSSIQTLSMLVLSFVNDALCLLRESRYREAALLMSSAYECMMHIQVDCGAYVTGRSRGGKLRHENDPKAKDKELVYQCWVEWKKEPGRYRSLAEFSRDMIEKAQHLAGDPQVIGRWVRAWKKGEGRPQ